MLETVAFKSTNREVFIFSPGFRFFWNLNYFVRIDFVNLYDSLGDKLD